MRAKGAAVARRALCGGEEPASGAGLAAGEAGSSCGPASAGSAEGRCTGLGQTWELRVARERVLGAGPSGTLREGALGWCSGAGPKRVRRGSRPGRANWAPAGVGKGWVRLLLGWVLVVGLGWVKDLGFLFPTLLRSKSNSNKV